MKQHRRLNLLCSFICALVFNAVFAYGLAFVNGLFTGNPFEIGIFRNAIRTVSPFTVLLLYWIGVRIVKLPQLKSLKIMQPAYIFVICETLIMMATDAVFFKETPDARGYNYLRNAVSMIAQLGFNFIFFLLTRLAAKKLRFRVDFPDNLVVKNIRTEIAKQFAMCCVYYAVVVTALYLNKDNNVYILISLLLNFLALMAFIILWQTIKNQSSKLANRDEHIVLLNQANAEFRGFKHDFNNILQTYSGFLCTEQYDKLKEYHNKVTKTALISETRLNISRRMQERPSFFSLLAEKLDVAKDAGLNAGGLSVCDMTEIYMDELDFNRVISNLIDNAIEAAKEAAGKHASFSVQQKENGGKLFIILNDAPITEVNMTDIFLPGYTTKPGHTGEGLPQVRDILRRYGNCTLNLTYCKGIFTAYFEMLPYGTLSYGQTLPENTEGN